MNNVNNKNNFSKLSSISGLENFLIITDLKGEIQLFNVTFSQLCNSANRDALLLSNQLSMRNFFAPEVGTISEIIKTLQEKKEWEGTLNFLLDYNLKLPIRARAQLLNPEPSSRLNILFSFELESFESVEVDPLAQKEFIQKEKSLKPIDEENELSLVESYEELRRIKEDLISSVSHELRTPLASIVGFSETIKNDPNLPENLRNEFIDIILN
ncbi:MAG: hypothetical protein N3A61_07405, partial [Ignavibacteria bacterium]|nr:hypothetical protein [Ignavibacteria bacterium]